MSKYIELFEAALVRGGTPAARTRQAVAELNDHYLRLVEEQTRQGLSSDEAQAEAAKTLGDPDALAEAMAHVHRKRFSLNPAIRCRLLGGFTILLAANGLWTTASLYRYTVANKIPVQPAQFGEAYYTMVVIVAMLLLLLLWCGFQILLQRRSVLQLFIFTCFLVVAGLFGVGALWTHPSEYPVGVTGLAGGGLAFVWGSLYPLWAPFVLMRSMRTARVVIA